MILQYVAPQYEHIFLACRQLRRAAWQCLGEWVRLQAASRSGWLHATFIPWWQRQQRRAGCGLLAPTLQPHLDTWHQVVEQRVAQPLQEGCHTGGELALRRRKGGELTLQRCGVVGVCYQASELEEDYEKSLWAMPWAQLWRKVWQLYWQLPTLSQRLGGGLDVRVRSLAFSHSISGFAVEHIWDRVLFTAMPMLQHYVPGYSLYQDGLHRPHRPAPRQLLRRVQRLAELAARLPPQAPSAALRQLFALMMRKPRPQLKLCTAEREVDYALRRTATQELWLYRRHQLVAVLTARHQLFPVEPEHLPFFERLGQHWPEVMAEYGRTTGRCGWCSRRLSSPSGEGPLCGATT
jgi:hypothetical protein